MDFNWFVGFYEGEGCPALVKKKYRGRSRYVYINLRVSQKNPIVLRKVKRFLKKSGFNHVCLYSWIVKFKNGKSFRYWELRVYSKDAARLAKRMLPKMQHPEKKAQLLRALRSIQ